MDKTLIKHPVVLSGIAAIAAIAVGSFAYYKINSIAPSYTFVSVQRGSVIQSVQATGQVNPTRDAALGFERSGKISAVFAAVGRPVAAGQVLVRLSAADLSAQADQARADIKAQQARLDQMRAGARKEDVQLKQSQLDKAKQDLANIYAGIGDDLRDAQSKADYAVRGQTNGFFLNPDTDAPRYVGMTKDSQAKIDVEYRRLVANETLTRWKSDLSGLAGTASQNDVDAAIKQAQDHLGAIRTYIDRLADVVNAGIGMDDATLSANKASVNAARAAIGAALTAVNGRQQALAAQALVVRTYQDQLQLTSAGNTVQEIEAQQAQVDRAVATLKGVEAQIAKTIIVAPFSGTVSKLNAKVGEIASPGASIVSLLSDKAFQVDANVPEVDVAKVHAGDRATVTLDAYGTGVGFDATIATIDPAQVQINGVPSYKVTLQFSKEDPRIKAGMTANATVSVASRADALLIPRRAIIRKENRTFVLLPDNGGKGVEREVTVGIESADGMAEVLSGLRDGDKVATFGNGTGI